MKIKIQKLLQIIKRPIIIKLLFPATMLLFSFTPKDNKKSNVPVIKKEVIIERPFQSINISGDISLILTNKPAGTVTIEGDENDVNSIRYRNKNNELIIDASRKKGFDQLTIYLSAATLKSMLVNGNGHIYSTGIIKTDDLHIWLNGDISVEINALGKVSVDAYYDYDLFWKSPINKS